jgi:uncharacterized membrane protein YuzA (DUF378 family)
MLFGFVVCCLIVVGVFPLALIADVFGSLIHTLTFSLIGNNILTFLHKLIRVLKSKNNNKKDNKYFYFFIWYSFKVLFLILTFLHVL